MAFAEEIQTDATIVKSAIARSNASRSAVGNNHAATEPARKAKTAVLRSVNAAAPAVQKGKPVRMAIAARPARMAPAALSKRLAQMTTAAALRNVPAGMALSVGQKNAAPRTSDASIGIAAPHHRRVEMSVARRMKPVSTAHAARTS